jgi:hypothetical protein
MVDDQILKAAAALVAAVDKQLSLLDAEIAAAQRRIAELEAIISAPAPLSFAELFFVESMLTPTLKEAEAKAAELPALMQPDAALMQPSESSPDAVDDASGTRPEDLDLERKLMAAYE